MVKQTLSFPFFLLRVAKRKMNDRIADNENSRSKFALSEFSFRFVNSTAWNTKTQSFNFWIEQNFTR